MPQLPGGQGTIRHFRQVAAIQWEGRAQPGTAGQLSPPRCHIILDFF